MEKTIVNHSQPTEYYEVYVWEWPVRLFHWVNFFSIMILAVTGYFIGNPISIASISEASAQYWFGKIRFVHFVTAYIFVFNSVIRIYWGFVGNKYVRFNNFIPTSRKQWDEILDVLKMDVLQIREKATHSVGHNALAGFIYAIGFVIFLFSVFTGFGLYSAMTDSWFAGLFAWVVPAMGGDHAVRLWHHMLMWFYLVFMIVHVYLAAYHDYVEATGTISSMFGGWKFLRKKKQITR
ncbi:MAG: Ni/Fe-hydrogenase, b-type cytochrome subunit [Calditrichaeota bacterium]|nr:Ni/Fe-hydrogenase, b-type cytochrome subunit [Calditrichota bacterium]RQW02964.1 MAG: Ni/Fe-hydrogenase, b-type cytochrome subunit [Calditrichota bacterium]